jgi:transcription-repair coupling factor (superfamily II helicase)
MLEKRLTEINRMCEKIVHSNAAQDGYNIALAKLMTQMEIEFNKSALSNKEFVQNNRAVIALYRKISMCRTIYMGG